MLGPKCDQQSWEVTTLTAHHHPPHHWQVLSPRARVEGKCSPGLSGLWCVPAPAPPRISWEVLLARGHFWSRRNDGHPLSCSGQKPPHGGQHRSGHRHFVKCLKGDIFARFCGPTADPCYHHLDASHWPPCPHPAGASAAGAAQAIAGFCRQSALKLLSLLKQPRGLRREAGAGRTSISGVSRQCHLVQQESTWLFWSLSNLLPNLASTI